MKRHIRFYPDGRFEFQCYCSRLYFLSALPHGPIHEFGKRSVHNCLNSLVLCQRNQSLKSDLTSQFLTFMGIPCVGDPVSIDGVDSAGNGVATRLSRTVSKDARCLHGITRNTVTKIPLVLGLGYRRQIAEQVRTSLTGVEIRSGTFVPDFKVPGTELICRSDEGTYNAIIRRRRKFHRSPMRGSAVLTDSCRHNDHVARHGLLAQGRRGAGTNNNSAAVLDDFFNRNAGGRSAHTGSDRRDSVALIKPGTRHHVAPVFVYDGTRVRQISFTDELNAARCSCQNAQGRYIAVFQKQMIRLASCCCRPVCLNLHNLPPFPQAVRLF